MDAIIENLLKNGPGYITATVLFFIYLEDKKRHKEERKEDKAELIRLTERQQAIEEKSQLIAMEHNKALQEVKASVEHLASLSRIEDQLQSLYDAQSKAK